MNRRSFLRTLFSAPFVAVAAPAFGRPTVPAFPILSTIHYDQAFGIDFEWTDIEVALGLDAAGAERSAETWAREHDRPFRVGDVVRVRVPQRFEVRR